MANPPVRVDDTNSIYTKYNTLTKEYVKSLFYEIIFKFLDEYIIMVTEFVSKEQQSNKRLQYHMNNAYTLIVEEMTKYDKLFDIIRVVNPRRKEVLVLNDNLWSVEKEPCYHFWNTGSICDNCISMRAINTNKNVIKIKYANEKVYAVTSVPVTIEEESVVIELFSDATESGDLMDDAIMEMKKIIERTNELTVHDALTGLYNRKFIDERLPFQIEKIAEQENPSFIVMCDIDHFKKVNDTYGHQTGDAVLKTISNLLSSGIRKQDWVARYGGEEFIIFLSNLTLEDVVKVMKRIKDEIESYVYQYKATSFSVTSSFGVAQIHPNDNPNSVINKADQLLYIAKANGRNNIQY